MALHLETELSPLTPAVGGAKSHPVCYFCSLTLINPHPFLPLTYSPRSKTKHWDFSINQNCRAAMCQKGAKRLPHSGSLSKSNISFREMQLLESTLDLQLVSNLFVPLHAKFDSNKYSNKICAAHRKYCENDPVRLDWKLLCGALLPSAAGWCFQQLILPAIHFCFSFPSSMLVLFETKINLKLSFTSEQSPLRLAARICSLMDINNFFWNKESESWISQLKFMISLSMPNVWHW